MLDGGQLGTIVLKLNRPVVRADRHGRYAVERPTERGGCPEDPGRYPRLSPSYLSAVAPFWIQACDLDGVRIDASGCVRIGVEDLKFLFRTASIGTKIYIY